MIRAAIPAIDVSSAPFALPPDIVLDLPVPPSTNRARKIDWANHKAVKAWKRAADGHVLMAKVRKINPLRLERIPRFEINITLSEDRTAIDLDNVLKVLLDFLCGIELLEDDGKKHMRRVVLDWGIAPEGVRVTVRPLGPARVGAYGVAG